MDLSWLIGRRLQSVEKKDFSWFFLLDDGTSIASESQWRLVEQRVVVSSEDHGHRFGLPSPVNACEVVRQNIVDSFVARFELDNQTSDLSLCFNNGATLQFLTFPVRTKDGGSGTTNNRSSAWAEGNLRASMAMNEKTAGRRVHADLRRRAFPRPLVAASIARLASRSYSRSPHASHRMN